MSENTTQSRSDMITSMMDELRSDQEPDAAPAVKRRSHHWAKLQDIKHLKPFLIRGLMVFLTILLIGQIYYATVTLPALNDGGPVSVETAVQQIGADLELPPEPPPAPR